MTMTARYSALIADRKAQIIREAQQTTPETVADSMLARWAAMQQDSRAQFATPAK